MNSKVITFTNFTPSGQQQKVSLRLTGKVLGQGQFGTVQFAVNCNDPTDFYAIKICERRKVQTQRDMQNLQNECSIQAEIDSDYVVRLKHATQTPNNFYLAMELCNGGDLQSYKVDRGGFLCEGEARMILKQLIAGLSAMK